MIEPRWLLPILNETWIGGEIDEVPDPGCSREIGTEEAGTFREFVDKELLR